MRLASSALFLVVLGWLRAAEPAATDPPPPVINSVVVSNGLPRLQWAPWPAADQYLIFSGTNLFEPLTTHGAGTFSGPSWSPSNVSSVGFYRLAVQPLSSNALLTATVLNRLAYGPTPDEWDRVVRLGPQAYIDEQLAPETIVDSLDQFVMEPVRGDAWYYVTASGLGTGSILMIYLSGAGEARLDDLRLAAGNDPAAGANLLVNGDFEAAFPGTAWNVSSNLSSSTASAQQSHGGNQSLHLVSTSTGSGQSSSIWQAITPALSSTQTYALGFWYRPGTNRSALTVRLSGSGINARPDQTAAGLAVRLNELRGNLDDLRAWFCLRAVRGPRQMLEILDQFLENHFVTQYSKSVSYVGSYYSDSALEGRLAADFEYQENLRWRQALLNPSCTYYDLLRISAESPAMIIYLDTVTSRGDGKNVANENYARELLELFTFGVDNGYDQNDITVLSRCWTGWTVDMVEAGQRSNPFALRSTNLLAGVTTNFTAISNLVGNWSFVFRSTNHHTNAKSLFPGKTVPARFGPPYAERSYQLDLPARSGTNGIADGYEVIAHLANQPFTQEFVCVKLCRLFVHDDFQTGYDFTDPDLSPEGHLVWQCMEAWESSSPRGQIRPVLATLFSSELFRSHGGSLQKVKTPLEYVASAIRVLRTASANGYTADTDGYSFATPLNRMGAMLLFERADPDGYPEAGPAWISAGTLAERLRFIQAYLVASSDSGHTDAGSNVSDPVGLLKLRLPAGQWSDAGAVADFFIGLIYPAEGRANLDLYRANALRFLNTADDGVAASPFSSLAVTAGAYDTRVRGLVSMLLTLPRFQEQ